MKAPDPHFYDDCLAVDSNYTNFAFEAQMQIMKGDGGGLIFRDQDTPQAYRNYTLDVFQDGSYDLYIVNASGATVLTSGNSSAIKQGVGQSNLVAVVAQGNTITVYINHQQSKSQQKNPSTCQKSLSIPAGRPVNVAGGVVLLLVKDGNGGNQCQQ